MPRYTTGGINGHRVITCLSFVIDNMRF